MEQDSYYGLLSGGDWHWFSAGKPGQDVFAGSFKEMKDGIIYCLSGTSHDQHVPVLPQETPQQS